MDSRSLHGTIPLGPSKYDWSRAITYQGETRHLQPRWVPIFRILAEHPNEEVSTTTLEEALPGDTPLKNHIHGINEFFRDFGLGQSIYIDNLPKQSYRLCVKEDLSETDLNLWSTVPATSSDSSTAPGFNISLDSMIVSAVVELLSNHGKLNDIIRQCRHSYLNCLEDFSFALVYSSQLMGGQHFRRSAGEPPDQRVEFLRGLRDQWKPQIFGESLRSGAILEGERFREMIRRDMESVSRSLSSDEWAWRDWVTYNAFRHIGRDESLLQQGVLDEEFKYDVEGGTLYSDPDLEYALGEPAVERLASFLRGGISAEPHRYTERALRTFVRRSVLTNVAIMREYQFDCEQIRTHKIYRLPHILRCSILKHTTYDRHTRQQRRLREVVVRHALSTALESVQENHRDSLVLELQDLRGEPEILRIRRLLEENHLILFDPDPGQDKKAERVLKEIRAITDPRLAARSRFTVDSDAIIKGSLGMNQIPSTTAGRYEDELHRVFPELKPK